jgi:hypothetical protein
MRNAFQAVRRIGMGAFATLLTLPGMAHHSTAMYDMEKTVTLKGVIKAFHWTSPHCSIDLFVPATNSEELWTIQTGPPTTLYREDWKPLMFKPGDPMTALVHPMRDGSHRALLISGTGADGRPKE